jgi:hypothetical protein
MLSMASEHVTQVKDLILSHGQEKNEIVSCYQWHRSMLLKLKI